jgi:hypothetical protein
VNNYLYDGEGRICAVQSLTTGAMSGPLAILPDGFNGRNAVSLRNIAGRPSGGRPCCICGCLRVSLCIPEQKSALPEASGGG